MWSPKIIFVLVALLAVVTDVVGDISVREDGLSALETSNATNSKSTKTVAKATRVPAKHLKDTKICYLHHECKFSGLSKTHVVEDAETAHNNPKDKSEALNVKLTFKIRSQCSSKTHRFFKMTVTKYQRLHHPEQGGGDMNQSMMKKYPIYFDQTLDGKIDKIYFSKGEPRFCRRIKQDLIQSLSQKIHQASLRKARRNPAKEVTYLFEDADTNGRYQATHTLKHERGSLYLLESKVYKAEEMTARNSKSKGVTRDGQKMDIEKKAKSKSEIGPNGRLKSVDATNKASVGTTKKMKKRPVMSTPSTGKSKMKVHTKVKRLEHKRVAKVCRRAEDTENHDITEEIADEIGEIDSLDLRAPWTREDLLPEEGIEDYQDHVHSLSLALKVLEQHDFDVNDLLHHVTDKNLEHFVSIARSRFLSGELSVRKMKTVLGLLSGYREPAAYKELLGIMMSPSAHPQLREQAAICLIHTIDEPTPPEYVVNTVAEVASRGPDDPMAQQATMLLGGLVEKRGDTPEGAKHIQNFELELSHLHPGNAQTAPRAMILLGALHNAGHAARPVAPAVSAFMFSPFKEVRESAIETLQKMGVNFAERQQIRRAMAARFSKPGSFGSRSDESEYHLQYRDRPTALTQAQTQTDVDEGLPANTEFSGYNADNEAEDDKDRKAGGRLLEQRIPLSGNENFGVNIKISAGAEWDRKQAAAFGNVALEAKVLFFAMEIMNIGADYRFHAVSVDGDGQYTVSKGRLSFLITLIGKKILEKLYPITDEDIKTGGTCAKDIEGMPHASRRPPTEFPLIIFFFATIFPAGPFPLELKVTLGGALGFQLLGAMQVDCKYQSKKGCVGIVGGLSPYAKAEVVMTATLNMGIATAGIEGVLLIVRGDLPIYGVANSVMACGRIDLILEALSGKISAFIKIIMGPKITVPILKWKGPRKRIPLFYQCKSVDWGHFPPLRRAKPKKGEGGKKGKGPLKGGQADDWNDKTPEEKREEEAMKKEQQELEGEDRSGPTGAETVRKMRRMYQEATGQTKDPKFGEDKDGWPFTNNEFKSEVPPHFPNNEDKANTAGGNNNKDNSNPDNKDAPSSNAKSYEEKMFKKFGPSAGKNAGSAGGGKGGKGGQGGKGGKGGKGSGASSKSDSEPYGPGPSSKRSSEPYEPQQAAARVVAASAEEAAKKMEAQTRGERYTPDSGDPSVINSNKAWGGKEEASAARRRDEYNHGKFPLFHHKNNDGTRGVPSEFRLHSPDSPTQHFMPDEYDASMQPPADSMKPPAFAYQS
mmetsp:Transcript_70554/g.106737  ORF Transcript_70554/g.106737 Transcript_70554/m.106737 type:complete len:1272 (+) Transcript_70554:60-3875(+)